MQAHSVSLPLKNKKKILKEINPSSLTKISKESLAIDLFKTVQKKLNLPDNDSSCTCGTFRSEGLEDSQFTLCVYTAHPKGNPFLRRHTLISFTWINTQVIQGMYAPWDWWDFQLHKMGACHEVSVFSSERKQHQAAEHWRPWDPTSPDSPPFGFWWVLERCSPGGKKLYFSTSFNWKTIA